MSNLEYTVDGWSNFCRVFRIPRKFPSGFCFDPIPVTILMVDWFYPVPELPHPAITKEAWIEEYGTYETKTISLQKLQEDLIPFIKKKTYYNPEYDYLVLCSFGASLYIKGDSNA